MKLIFSLAVITDKNQKVEELLKPYLHNADSEDLQLCINKQRNFISGILFGYFDLDYDSRQLFIKNNENTDYKGKIKDIDWQKIVDFENEQLKEKGIDIEKAGVNLEKRFGFTNAIITPDGKWHGMIPLDLITVSFKNKESCENYIKDYYTKYIKPYEKEGSITILTCNI